MAVVLASTSRIRQSMLRAAGVNFTVRSPGVDESAIKLKEVLEPRQMAIRLAKAKAQSVSYAMGKSLVVGADQILALGGTVLDKPTDKTQAREHLLLLRGKTHVLHSAAVCAREGKVLWAHCDVAVMAMRFFSEAFLDCFISQIGQDITSSVGAYKIEENGIQLFESIVGSYFTVLGLPLLPLLGFLRMQGELQQ